MNEPPSNNGWYEWKNYVLSELAEQREQLKRHRSDFSDFKREFDIFRVEVITSAAERRGSSKTWAALVATASSIVLVLLDHLIFKK